MFYSAVQYRLILIIEGVSPETASIVIWEYTDPRYLYIWQHGRVPGENITKVSIPEFDTNFVILNGPPCIL